MKKILTTFVFLILVGINFSFSTRTLDTYQKLDKVTIINIEKEKPKGSDKYKVLLDKLAKSESEHDWKIINTVGCFGKYQFKESTLKDLGYTITLKQFKENPECFNEEMQEEAALKLIETNRKILRSIIEKHQGSTINGIYITETGILAAAHLAGPTGVQNYFNESKNATDKYGTSVETYLNKFSII